MMRSERLQSGAARSASCGQSAEHHERGSSKVVRAMVWVAVSSAVAIGGVFFVTHKHMDVRILKDVVKTTPIVTPPVPYRSFKGTAHDEKSPIQNASISTLPKWVETGILHTTDQLKSAQAKASRLDKDSASLQKEVGALTAENMQLKVRLRQAEHEAENDKLALQESARPAPEPLRRGLPPLILGSSGHDVTPSGGIVALSNFKKAQKPIADAADKQKTPAKGWLTIAVHGTHAVVQTPEGQVALVHVGSSLDGAKITSIDTSKKAVVLNNQQWVYPPK